MDTQTGELNRDSMCIYCGQSLVKGWLNEMLSGQRTQFARLPVPERLRVLSTLSDELSIAVKYAHEYDAVTLKDPIRISRIDAIRHRISGHRIQTLLDNPSRCPDVVVLNIILANDDEAVNRLVEFAFARAMHRVNGDT